MIFKKKKLKSPVRDLKSINGEYGTTCGHLGEAIYKQSRLKKEIEAMTKRLVELEDEYKIALAKDQEEKAKAEAKEQAAAAETAPA